MSSAAYRFSGNDAANYDRYLGPLLFEPSAKELVSRLNAGTGAGALQPRAILEVSCGTGRLTKHLRENFPAATSLTATDISTDMLDLAQRQFGHLPIHFQTADAQHLPFGDESFDLVVNQYGLMFLPDIQSGFNEAYRVLQPGGHFVFATWDSTKNMSLFRLIIDDTVIPFFVGDGGGSRDGGVEADVSRFYTPFSLHNAGRLTGYLERAGFKRCRADLVIFKGQTDDVKNIVNGLFLKHPLGREVKEKDPAAVGPMADVLEQKIIRQFGTAPFDIELRAYVGVGEK